VPEAAPPFAAAHPAFPASPDAGGAWAPTGQPDTAPAAIDSAYYPSDAAPSPPKLVQVPKTALLGAAVIVALSGLVSVIAAIKSCSKGSAPAPLASATAAPSASAQAANATPSGAAAPSAAPAESLTPAPTSAPEVTTPFSAKAARTALNATGRDVGKCKRTKLWGTGEAAITFASDGTVSHVAIGSPFRGTPSGECVSEILSAVQIAPFGGVKAATINYKFFIPIK
jgi:hypothetical protein